jgi:hypothetical protein
METRNIPLIALFLFLASALYAQGGGYYIDTGGDSPRFFQRLFWYGDENILYYKVFIQEYQEENEGVFEYRDIIEETTTANFIAVSLRPGKYRFSVIPYDLLELPAERSEWREFEILPGLFPSIESFSPFVFYLDQRLERVLNITGDNLSPESEIYLRGERNALFPIEMEIISEGQVRLVFDDKELIPGRYEIYVKNPGGLEASAGFFVGYRKPFDYQIKTLWSPVIPVYGGMNKTFGADFNPAGTYLSFEMISSKRSILNGGLEFSAAGYAVNSAIALKKNSQERNDGYDHAGTSALWMEANLNIVLQKRFMQGRMVLNTRFGIGTTVMGAYGEYKQNRTPLIHGNFGLSYMYLLYDILYIEAGVDFTHVNSIEPDGLLKPRLGLCWKF